MITMLVGVAAADWSDNFDSYSPGGLHGLGGWAGWDNDPQWDATVTNSISTSSPNSVGILPSTDIVQEFDESSGSWLITAMQYIPSGGSNDQFFIMHNVYSPGGTFICVHDLIFYLNTGTVEFYQAGSTASIVFDQWVEIKVEVNLDANTQSAYYNGTLLGSAAWATTGAIAIATINLFSWGASTIYYDDLEMVSTTATLEQMSWAGLKAANH